MRGKPIDAAKHYLEHGAAEGRNPSPLFNTKWYLQQNPDVAVSGGNPFVHYVLRGQREGRAARPPDLNGAHVVADTPAAIFTTQSSQISEPGIKPPPLLPAGRLSVTEICRRNAKSVVAIRALKEKSGVTGGQSQFADLCAAKMSLAGADDGLSSAQIGTAFAEISESGEQTSRADIVAGVGITPSKRLKESDLPEYYVPILQRYNEGRFEVTRRFEWDPSKSGSVKTGPRISLLVPVYRTPIVFLERAILSVVFQTYANWELILVDDRSQRSEVEAVLRFYENVDPRIKVRFRSTNGGISAASNDALALAGGEYIGLLDHDDMLTRDALEKVAARLVADRELDFVYTDECKIDRDDIADDLFYKPDWSPFLLLNFMYTGHFTVYRKTLVERVGGFRSRYDFSQDYDLALRIAERQPKVAHIDECLYGWRMIPGSGASGDRADARVSNIAALQDAADRRGYNGVAIPLPTANRVKRALPAEPPLVSIVIPSDNSANIVASIETIVSRTTYDRFEIVVVANSGIVASLAQRRDRDKVRFVAYDKPFNFSDKCNVGASSARGDYVVFYNDDVRVISPDWIEGLLEYLTLPGVGGVSPKLIYENGSIQYAGMITGVRRLVGTAFHTYPAATTAYFNMAQSVREVSLLSGACLAMPTALFHEIGGFDKNNVPVAHSDVDLCFRIRDSGKSCIYTPHAELMHIGHLSIGTTEAEATKKEKPFTKDKADIFLLKRWGKYLQDDPYFPRKLRELVYIDSQEPFRYFPGHRADTRKGPDALIFSHDLSASGAPRLAYDIASVLIGHGCFVVVISPEDGAFRQTLLDAGADVIVDPLALQRHETITDLAKNFDLVVANTVVCWPIVSQLGPFAPIYWYVHETGLIRDFADKDPEFLKSFADANAVWVGSQHSAEVLRTYGIEPDIFEYGVEEPRKKSQPGDKVIDRNGIVISVLATFEPRKGQDLAILGFLAMPEDLRNRCSLRLAGRGIDSEFYRAIKAMAEGCERIDFEGELDYQTYLDRLATSDIVLCASRDDTLPLVSLNALAAGKILVCSRETGTSSYVRDGISGFVMPFNGPKAVTETLTRAIHVIDSWTAIGVEARGVFMRNFSQQRFRSRLVKELGFTNNDITSNAELGVGRH